MEKPDAIAALAALAQDNRFDIFRLLARAGPAGMPAGAVATALGLAANTLTFHFDRLKAAGLVTVRRDGRSMIYAARADTLNALLGFLGESGLEHTPPPPPQEPEPSTPVPAQERRRVRRRVSAWGLR